LGLTGLTRPTESKSIGRPLILRSLRLQMTLFFFFSLVHQSMESHYESMAALC
jgi:hypothetical protein